MGVKLYNVFVYGTLLSGEYNHDVLGDSELTFSGYVKIPYRMINLGAFPALIKDTKEHKIYGEIYSVTKDVLKDLDMLEGVPILYKRAYVKKYDIMLYELVNVPDNKPEIRSGNWLTKR